jgi:hypothetical protein
MLFVNLCKYINFKTKLQPKSKFCVILKNILKKIYNLKIKESIYLYNMILVTGATGLVGSHLLISFIRANDTVKAFMSF